MPLYTTEALVLRTYKLAEAHRIVVFLTRDRGKKRGVAHGARGRRSRFGAALEPLTRVRVAYFEKERRELVNVNYAEALSSPLWNDNGAALGHVSYFAELIDEWSPEGDPNETVFRLGAAVLDAIGAGRPIEPLARYFEYWLLRLQGVYPPTMKGTLSTEALAFLGAVSMIGPDRLADVSVSARVVREIEQVHRTLIANHLEKELKSARVLRELRG